MLSEEWPLICECYILSTITAAPNTEDRVEFQCCHWPSYPKRIFRFSVQLQNSLYSMFGWQEGLSVPWRQSMS